jgi:hypothetical protein
MKTAFLVVSMFLVGCAGTKPKQQQPDVELEQGDGERDMLEEHEIEEAAPGETTSYETDVDVELSDHETEKHDDAEAATAVTPGAMKHTNRPTEGEDESD